MTNFKALAERLDSYQKMLPGFMQFVDDMSAAAQLAREKHEQESRQSTHSDGCWTWGPRHYDCALREISRLQPGARERAEAPKPNDDLRKALLRAFSLGQAYWSQADSESYAANRRSGETKQKFDALVEETLAKHQPAAQPAIPEALAIVSEQAQDDGLWFVATTAPEGYLQAALRRLHAAVEAAAQPQSDPTAIEEAAERLTEMLTESLGTKHPAIDDLATLILAAKAQPQEQHLSVVAKIVRHGLDGDVAGVRSYAELLLDKARTDQDERTVRVLEEHLGLRDPGLMIQPQEQSEPSEAEIGTCLWSTADDDTDVWETSCGHAFTINEGTPTDNQMTFCCYCGKRVEEDAAFAAKDER